MGQVPGEVMAAAFGCFNPKAVVPAVTAGWQITSREAILMARERGATAMLRRVLGDEPEGLGRVTGLLPNAVLDKILLSAPVTAGEEVNAGEASPAELFHHIRGVSTMGGGPVRVNSFYTYDGSLTTPGCTQDVRWSVLADGGHVSTAAVARLHKVIARFRFYEGYPNNNRPVQPLNGRVIKLRRGKHD